MSRAGLSRVSSTSGLYDTPRSRIRLPFRGFAHLVECLGDAFDDVSAAFLR